MTETLQEAKPAAKENAEQWDTVQRVVFPPREAATLWPLYVDWGIAPSSAAIIEQGTQVPEIKKIPNPPRIASRKSMVIPQGQRLSLATYFNAFPAAYWQHWTKAKEVRLTLEIKGAVAIEVLRSSVRGTFTTVETAGGEGTFQFTIPLNRFGDGGWVWPEITALDSDAELVSGTWAIKRLASVKTTKLTIGITTFNMAKECVAQANRFVDNPDVLERISEILIVDQGTKNVKDEPGYAQVQAALGKKLRIIEQPNLGGSGGFSRGMYEMLKNPDSDYVLLLDDDAEVEPEGVLRAISFADHAYRPIIVGGHMFNFNEKTILHSWGEKLDLRKFWWEPVVPELTQVDLAQRSIRTDPLLNRRLDVMYNGWWMCLIPKQVVEKIGLSLPVFIKWDDAEYGIRAAKNGFPTVSFPGAAVWHVPWSEKDDGLDWQAYFHQRNRWIGALLHSRHKSGGRLPTVSFATDLKCLLSMQYYASDLRIQGLRDLLSGPAHLHPTMAAKAAEARKLAANYSDAVLLTDSSLYPDVEQVDQAVVRLHQPEGKVRLSIAALKGILHQSKKTDPKHTNRAQRHLATFDARWWKLSSLDSVLVSNAEGSGVWHYKRDEEKFRANLLTTLKLHRQLSANWDELQAEYQQAFAELVSVEAWETTFGIR